MKSVLSSSSQVIACKKNAVLCLLGCTSPHVGRQTLTPQPYSNLSKYTFMSILCLIALFSSHYIESLCLCQLICCSRGNSYIQFLSKMCLVLIHSSPQASKFLCSIIVLEKFIIIFKCLIFFLVMQQWYLEVLKRIETM